MKFGDIIDRATDWPMLPIQATERSEKKAVRIFGYFVFIFWFIPAVIAWFIAAVLLIIPVMIQDA